MIVHKMVGLTLMLFLFSISIAHSQNTVPIECGDIVEAETTPNNPAHDYVVNVSAGTTLQGTVSPFGDNFNIFVVFRDSGGGLISTRNDKGAGGSEIFDFITPSSNPILHVVGTSQRHRNDAYTHTGRNFGAYTISLACILRDGSRLPAGGKSDSASIKDSPNEARESIEFSGFGLPMVGPVDFSRGIQIPLELGAAQSTGIGGDVELFTYSASEDETAILRVLRLSGNISIGVTVINKDTNEIIFLGGLPSSNNLSVELTFPTGGTYAIGLFRLDTAEHTGTSGAVQIVIE